MANSVQVGELPDHQQIELAREGSAALARLLRNHPQQDRARVRMDDEDLILPRQAIELLRHVLSEMAQGNGVSILPVHAELTTQQAADMLNVSRPYLVRLLEEGTIAFSKVGTHRRISLSNLMEYKRQRDEDSAAALQELVDQAQELDLGY